MTLPLVAGVSDVVPEDACAPVQPPLAVQVVPAEEDQVSVALWPSVMLVGATEIVTVGGGGAGVPPPPPPPQAESTRLQKTAAAA